MQPHTTYDPASEHLPEGGGQPNHRRPIKDLPDVLDVVAVVSNPARYESRYNLYRTFERHMRAAGVRLTTVELAFGGRCFEVTEAGNPRHVQLRTSDEFWAKEVLINAGIARLPRDWRYAAWIDADVSFARHDWAQETLHQLQHHPVVQLWSEAHDLGPHYEVIETHRSFAACYLDWVRSGVGDPADESGGYGVYGVPHAARPGGLAVGGAYWHPGFAWAARREWFDAVGGLLDWAVLGAGDHHMAKALIGRALESVHGGVSRGYKDAVLRWQAEADAATRRDLGVVAGLVLHHWHGRKRQRYYQARWSVLVDTQFDPALDLKRDWQGLWRLTGRSIALRDGIRSYFRARNEDSIDVD